MSDLTTHLRELRAKAMQGPWEHVAVRHMQHEVFTPEDERAEGLASIHCDHATDAALIAAAINALPELLDAAEERDRLAQEVVAKHAALTKINAIRNDIVGRQAIGFSEHVYPLVAALNTAGYESATYEVARRIVLTQREKVNGLIVQRDAARAECERLRAAGNALASVSYHQQRRGFTADCETTCVTCAWNKLSPLTEVPQ